MIEERGLRIEQVDMRGSAREEQADDMPGLAGSARARVMAGGRFGAAQSRIARKNSRQPQRADSAEERAQELPP